MLDPIASWESTAREIDVPVVIFARLTTEGTLRK